MRIEAVEYRETKTFRNYQNVTIGATARVEIGEHEDQALEKLREWVRLTLLRRIQKEERFEEDQHEIHTTSIELNQAKRNLEDAKALWVKAQAFLAKHGLALDDEEIPF